jgi:signal transduction histidine kinase
MDGLGAQIGLFLARRQAEDQVAVLLERERVARGEADTAVQVRDEFLSVAAHELKTPITSLRATADLALRRLEREHTVDPARVERDYRTIRQQCERLARLVELLLDVSRLETGKFTLSCERVDLARLVMETVAAAAVRAPWHHFVCEAPPSLPADVDPLRIEQVLTNLLENASKFSPPGAAIEVRLVDAGDGLECAVRDHGVGIPEEHRKGIFARYHQAHAQSYQSGLGLGLYVSRQIMEQHGGSIRVEFPDDGGTRFVVTLPRAAAIGLTETPRSQT